jgi:hypothetical protein
LQEENNRLKKELDKTIGMMQEMSHKLNVEISNSQMQVLKQKSDYERQIDDLNHKIDALQSEKKANEDIIHELKEKNSAQEREFLEKLRITSEEQWTKMSSLEADKSNVSLNRKSNTLTHSCLSFNSWKNSSSRASKEVVILR